MKIFAVLFAILAFVCLSMAVKNEMCSLPTARNGNGKTTCMAYIPSFSYNAATNECDKFIYGGCGGNANRFRTLTECEQKCKE